MQASQSGSVLIDGHVHLHRCFDIADALDAAVANFGAVRSKFGFDEGVPGVVWLVEHDDEGASGRLMAAIQSEERWLLDKSDGVCLHVRRLLDGESLTVILGQQVRTSEDLEILVVGSGKSTPSGLTLTQSIETSLDPGALVMIPWGFGKWTAGRGVLVRQAYEAYVDRGLRLADTGAHTRFRPQLTVFDLSRASGVPVLAGSDPFPFRGQQLSIGRTGFVVDSGPEDLTWPALLSAIRSLEGQPQTFGSHRPPLEFAWLQGRMQLRKRLGGR